MGTPSEAEVISSRKKPEKQSICLVLFYFVDVK